MLLNEVGLQLYSLRDETKDHFYETIETVALMGYKGVEFAGYGGLSPKRLAQILRENGLKVYGSHIGALPKSKDDMQKEIEMNLEIGNSYLICPYFGMKDRDETLRFAETLNEYSAQLEPLGLHIGYHNHAHEFVCSDGMPLIDLLLKETVPEVVMEFDVFWIAYAGYDPLEYIAKYKGRQPVMHLKELGMDRKSNVEIGTGILNFPAIIHKGLEGGTKHFIIEQEEYTMKPIESCKASLDAVLRM